MFLCFVDNGAGGWNTSQVFLASDCTSGFIAQSPSTFFDIGALDALFKTYFAFDADFFSLIIESNLLVFISAFVIGRVNRALTR